MFKGGNPGKILPRTLGIGEIGRGGGHLFAGSAGSMLLVIPEAALTSRGIPSLGMKAEWAQLVAFQRWVQMMHLFSYNLSAFLFLQELKGEVLSSQRFIL